MTCLKTSCTIRAGWGMVIVSIFLKEERKKERGTEKLIMDTVLATCKIRWAYSTLFYNN